MSDIFAFLPTATAFLTNGERPVQLSKALEKKDKDIWEVEVIADLVYADVMKQDYILFMKSRYGYQPFRLSNIETGDSTYISIAKHVGFDTKNYLVTLSTPINANCQTAMQDVLDHAYPTSPFTVYSDITSLHTLTIENMNLFDAFTALADAYSGYLDFDGFQVRITANEGANRDVTVEYQKNLIGATVSENWDLVVTDMMPVSTSGLTIPSVWLHSDIVYDKAYARRVEFETDTVENLEFLAGLYLARYKVPRINYVLKSEVLQDVYRGDTIYCNARQFSIFMEVISYENDILREIVTAVEFGNYRNTLKTFFGTLRSEIQAVTLQKAQFRIDEIKGVISLLAIDVTTVQTQANLGVTNAATAQSAANAAQGTANTATTNAATANGLLADLASDNKLTAVEKQMVKKEWDGIVSEKTLNDTQATTFGITTEKTAYGTSYTTLSTYITPLLTNLATTSDIVGATFRANFKDYYDKLTTLLNAIASKSKTLADAAQSTANTAVTNAATAQTQANLGVANAALAQTKANQGVADALEAHNLADTAQTAANGAQTTANTAKAYTDNLALDSVITPDEKISLKREWDLIVVEGTATTGKIPVQATLFGVADTAFDTAYSALNTYLNTTLAVFAVMTTTTTGIVRVTWDTKWKNYYNARTDLLNAIAAQTKTLADTAQAGADQGLSDAAAAQRQADAAVAAANGLTTRMSAAEVKITPQAITQTVEETSTLLAKKAYVDITAGAAAISAAEVIRDEYGELISNLQSFFDFLPTGMLISMLGSEFATLYAADKVAFMQNGNILQWLSGNKNFMTDLTLTGALSLPKHKFETLPNGHTVLRNIGG